MNIFFRVDASLEMGTGHFMRCIALAERLHGAASKIHFLCADLPALLESSVTSRGYSLCRLPEIRSSSDWKNDRDAVIAAMQRMGPVDLLVVDHYAIDATWETSVRRYASRVLVIDDLANRDHDCDFLLDQNLHDDAAHKYRKYIGPDTICFFGPKYALLRAEFDDESLLRNRSGTVSSAFIFFGGTDPGGHSLVVLDALGGMKPDFPRCVVVLGPANPFYDEASVRAANIPFVNLLASSDRMSKLMSEADIAIGSCGIAAWERCALGLPAIVAITAENQREDARILARLGAVENLGEARDIKAEDWANALTSVIGDQARVRAMSTRSLDVMAGCTEARVDLVSALLHGRP
jgi:UDP-2,4-diacetamido-2,4,6-trideoxy-beta-L-altropyranose hydrolase